MNKLHFIIVLSVVLAITMLTYILSSRIDDTSKRPDPNLRHDPDYFISDFIATMYDVNGKASYHVKATHLDHFPDDDSVHVRTLEVKYLDKEQQTWLATSDRGIGYENIKVLHLHDNVKIENLSTDPNKRLVLFTDQLRIDFNKRQAETSSQVKILGKNSTINAVGMDIDLNTGIMNLRSEAQGQYVPY